RRTGRPPRTCRSGARRRGRRSAPGPRPRRAAPPGAACAPTRPPGPGWPRTRPGSSRPRTARSCRSRRPASTRPWLRQPSSRLLVALRLEQVPAPAGAIPARRSLVLSLVRPALGRGAAGQVPGQGGGRGVVERRQERQLAAQRPLDLALDPHEQQGVTAELEEVVVGADPLTLQHLLPDLRQPPLQLSPRRLVPGSSRLSLRRR